MATTNNPFMPATPGKTTPTLTPNVMPTNNAGGVGNFEVDLSGVTNAFSVPDGLYRVRCVEIEQTVSKGGNPMFVWTFAISAGPHVGFESKVFTALTPAAMWKVAETVVALGVGQQGQVVKFKRSDVINKECGALIEATEYNGQTRSQISKVITLKELAESSSHVG